MLENSQWKQHSSNLTFQNCIYSKTALISFFKIFIFYPWFKDTINPLQLFVEKHQFFNQNNQWLNNIIYH